jgi:hypothetical protein
MSALSSILIESGSVIARTVYSGVFRGGHCAMPPLAGCEFGESE